MDKLVTCNPLDLTLLTTSAELFVVVVVVAVVVFRHADTQIFHASIFHLVDNSYIQKNCLAKSGT